MACGAWTSIKNKVPNLKTNQSRRCKGVKYRNTAFSFLAVILKSVLTHVNMSSQQPFTCLADFFYNKAYFSKCSQPIHQLYRILCDESVGRSFCAPALVLLRAQALHFQTQCQSVFAILVNMQSWGGSFILVTVHTLWINDELILMVRIRDTNLVVLYWLYRSVLFGK